MVTVRIARSLKGLGHDDQDREGRFVRRQRDGHADQREGNVEHRERGCL
jgi:hypothetical protein